MPVLTLLLLLSSVVPAAKPAAASAAESPPSWLVINRAGDGHDAAEAWNRLWREKGNATDMAFLPIFADLSHGEGDLAGHWHFAAGVDAAAFVDGTHAGKPTAAWRMVLPVSAPYVVRVDLYCDEDGGGCTRLRDELAAIRAPAPRDESLWPHWIAIVEQEPCTPGPVQMPAPGYPPQPLRRGVGGRVTVEVLFNRCGEVRHAWLHESSGDRDLDRAAVDGARRWRVALPENGARIGRGLVPIGFDPATADSPESAAR